jgi:hypothetical protein
VAVHQPLGVVQVRCTCMLLGGGLMHLHNIRQGQACTPDHEPNPMSQLLLNAPARITLSACGMSCCFVPLMLLALMSCPQLRAAI